MSRSVCALVILLLAAPATAQTAHDAIASELEALAAKVRGLAVTVVGDTAGLRAAALNAPTGSIIELRAGAYAGPITIARRLTLQGPAEAILASPGTGEPALIVSGEDVTVRGGLTITGRDTYDLVVLGGTRVVVDQVHVAGIANVKRGIRLDGAHVAVTRSRVTGIWRPGQDSQAIAGWNGPGPYLIEDNVLEAASENILFGGADPSVPGLVPSDIVIRRNTLRKDLAWKGKGYNVKNLLELKNARRVVITDNLLEHNWTDAQTGWAVLFTPVNQDGGCAWCVVDDVLVERNVIRHTENGFNLTGRGYTHPTQPSGRYVLRSNVFEGTGRFLMAASEVSALTVEGNVVDHGYNVGQLYRGGVREADGASRTAELAVTGLLVWRGNVQRDVGYGIHCEAGIGTVCLTARTGSYQWADNRIVNRQYTYPAGTSTIDEAAFQAAKAALLQELGR